MTVFSHRDIVCLIMNSKDMVVFPLYRFRFVEFQKVCTNLQKPDIFFFILCSCS